MTRKFEGDMRESRNIRGIEDRKIYYKYVN